MKELFEIAQTLNKLRSSRRANLFAPVEIQALEWAYEKRMMSPLSIAEKDIRRRIEKLQFKQASKESMAFAKPARAKQINALKWVINEMDVDRFEPLY